MITLILCTIVLRHQLFNESFPSPVGYHLATLTCFCSLAYCVSHNPCQLFLDIYFTPTKQVRDDHDGKGNIISMLPACLNGETLK